MVLGLWDALFGVVVTVLLALGAVAGGALTPWAGVTAAVFGSVIVVAGGFPFLALIVLFVVASVLATRFRIEEKKRRHVQEGVHGERGVSNVLAHILVPTGVVLATVAVPQLLSTPTATVLYSAALSFGAADTFASEFGVLVGRARSILSFRPVEPGTNGGVSVAGELWALAGALTTAIVAAVVFRLFLVPVPPAPRLLVSASVGGFLGCQVDSLLGELLENRGWLTKGSTNLAAMLASVGIAGGVLVLLGGGG